MGRERARCGVYVYKNSDVASYHFEHGTVSSDCTRERSGAEVGSISFGHSGGGL